MKYEKIWYMCPECDMLYAYDKSKDYSTICPECNVEMICTGTEFTSTEEDEEWERKYEAAKAAPKIYCPYCKSCFTQKIGFWDRLGSAELWGLGSPILGKQFHCNNCGADF